MLNNSYPEKPILPYKKTTVSMTVVNPYIASLHVPAEVKRAAYVLFRNESANGSKGVNNNYCGIQADSGRWQKELDALIVGTVKLKENQTGRERLFVAFKDFTGSIAFLINRVQARGLYVGGTTHKILTMHIQSAHDLAVAYQCEWVKGEAHAKPTAQELSNFLSMYNQAKALFW